MNRQNQATPDTENGIKILYADVSDSLKEEILNKMIQLLSSSKSKEDAAIQLKKYLDDKYGRSWVVLLTADCFWLQATQIDQSICCFRTKNTSCLIWRTYEGD